MKFLNLSPPKLVLFLGILCCRVSIAEDELPKSPEAFGPGDHVGSLILGDLKRTYLVHVPKNYDANHPTPVVLAFHGAAMNGQMMVWFSGLNKKSEDAGFIAVYPSGTGVDPLLTWNAGNFPVSIAESRPDDVAFVGQILDQLSTVVNVDKKRVFACGMSNGAMMCYRLASELSDRIAAVAPVAGTIAVDESHPKRPVSVIHFHGTKDTLVPYKMPEGLARQIFRVKGVEDSVETWVNLDGCNKTPVLDTLSKADDTLKVTRKTYGQGKDESEVVLVTVEEGGHTWPGQRPPIGLGKSAKNISANDLIWEFFLKHPMK